tara:strand:+ start:66 stop:608 length:543 start_codon:yes stop_codon:yes gene_type:complete
MKLNLLPKTLPFISTLIFIIFLYISNQKVNTRLRILIWNTPSYSLGTYLATSTGIGFMVSYILTTNLANINRLDKSKSLKYKYESINENTSKYNDSYVRLTDEKTLIERDINDPSPTVNAKFRVIGKTERYDTKNVGFRNKYDNSNDYQQSYFERDDTNEFVNEESPDSSDWNDESFSNW